MELKVCLSLLSLFVCAWTPICSASLDNFQAALDQAANDLNNIDPASADRFKKSVGIQQAAPVTEKPCVPGWFSKCPTTTQAPTTTTTTTVAPPAPEVLKQDACGGWFQPACVPTTTTTTTPLPSTLPAPLAQSCGWFSSCAKPQVLTNKQPTSPPTDAPKPCGGWFQSACEITTTPAPAPLAKSCGGWFQSKCEPELTTTPLPKTSASGLFGTFSQKAENPAAKASTGWFTGLIGKVGDTVDTVKSTAGKAVSTAVDIASKITTASLNGGLDFLLAQIKLVVKTTNMDVIPLPALDIPLYTGASLQATGGYFKSVMSIGRGGDIVVSRDGMAMVIDFPLQLKDMEIGFKNYSITVLMGMGTSGDIKVGVATNKINTRIRLAMSTSCAINLEMVDFAVLDGLDIHMSYGCSYCGFITDKATTYLVNTLQNTIRLQIQGQIDSILKKTLSENSLICSKFMGIK